MHTFSDTLGRIWTIHITVDTIKRVRALTGTDLLAVAGGDLLERLSTDPVLLADVVYAVIQPEAEARQVTDIDFGRALAGDVINSAASAVLEDLVDFFPAPKRALLAKALGKLTEVQNALLNAATARMEALDATSLAQQALSHGASSGASPASSVATPAG
jgi:hypothetical protein